MSANLYETDHAAWLERQAALLKSGCLAELDREHLAEELEWEVGNERREIYKRLRILMVHLLKWQYRPEQRSASWAGTIRVQRKDLGKLLKDNPSLRRFLAAEALDAYTDAVDLASFETGIPEADFPAENPYPLDALLDKDFWPD